MGTNANHAIVGSTSYQKINWLTYFKEGHLQMKVRFPNASHLPVLWPFLWFWTFVCFLKNNRKLRNTTFRAVLREFKKKMNTPGLSVSLKTATLNNEPLFYSFILSSTTL